jgi:hypothetical protein
MKWQEQKDIFEEMVEHERELLNSKGREYAADDDCLANFNSKSDLGVTPLQTAYIFLDKHLSSIKSYIRIGHEISNESIEGRIHDARNYLALIAMLIKEKKTKP